MGPVVRKHGMVNWKPLRHLVLLCQQRKSQFRSAVSATVQLTLAIHTRPRGTSSSVGARAPSSRQHTSIAAKCSHDAAGLSSNPHGALL